MRNVKQIQEELDVLYDRVEAITALAQEEDRALSDEETTEIDSIMGSGDNGGKQAELKAELKRAQKLEDLQRERAAARVPVAPIAHPGLKDAPEEPTPRVKVPAQARYRYASLKAFDGPFADEQAYTAGQFYLATLFGSDSARAWCQEHGIDVKAAMSGASNPDGGYLVPVELDSAIVDLREQYGVFRANADVRPMGSDTKDVPVRSSGLTAYFSGDNAALTESTMQWGNAKLTAKKVHAFTRMSSEVAEDAIISLGDHLTTEIAYALANKEDSCGFLGDGTSTYGGIVGLISSVGSAGTVTAATGNTAYSTLDLTDFESMVGKLPQYPGIQPAWYIHKAGWAASMMRLQDAAGGNTNSTLGVGIPSPMFLGYPVRFAQVMNSTLTAQTSTDGLCYFGDLRMAAVLGNRRGVTVAVSDQRYFEYDQIAVRGTSRFDINCHSVGDSSNAGAIIMLSTPSS